jgi:hypothetical protein
MINLLYIWEMMESFFAWTSLPAFTIATALSRASQQGRFVLQLLLRLNRALQNSRCFLCRILQRLHMSGLDWWLRLVNLLAIFNMCWFEADSMLLLQSVRCILGLWLHL